VNKSTNWPNLKIRQACALSFYFQPAAPRNKAHKEDAILAKDLAREALRQLESSLAAVKERSNSKKDKCESARADLDRIVRLSQDWRGNGGRGNARQSGIRLLGSGLSGGSTICPRN
jgi:hypothetical protein